MTIPTTCRICRLDFLENERVIFSHRDTFIFKPAHIKDIEIATPGPGGAKVFRPAAAILSPDALAKTREDYKRTVVVNTFGDWGKMQTPEGAFNFRHQWCEPVRTGSGYPQGPGQNKHAIRFARSMTKRSHY